MISFASKQHIGTVHLARSISKRVHGCGVAVILHDSIFPRRQKHGYTWSGRLGNLTSTRLVGELAMALSEG